MRILIVTQSVDKNNPILGFFHRWVDEFAKNFEEVIVICLEKGEYDLPENVKVLSLGKEEGKSKIGYIINFYKFIWNERKKYDVIFVHMNEEYVLMGGWFWKLFRKKILLWRNHVSGTIKTRIAVLFSYKVFCTSEMSFTKRFKKTEIMPVGIDDLFFRDFNLCRNRKIILYVGRISAVKKIEVLIDAMVALNKIDDSLKLYIFGPVIDEEYLDLLKNKIIYSNLQNIIEFRGSVKQHELPQIYSSYGICVNTTNSGSFDKTIIESAFCSIMPLVSNTNFSGIFGREIRDIIEFKEFDSNSLVEKIININRIDDQRYKIITDRITLESKKMHSLISLVERIKIYL